MNSATGGPLTAGQQLPDWTTDVSAETQLRCLTAAQVDPAPYGDVVDMTLLGNECYRALTAAGVSFEGWIQMEQHFEQHRQVRLGESLEVKTEVKAVDAHARGTSTHLVFDFANGGDVALRAEIIALLPDDALTGPAETPETSPMSSASMQGFEKIATKQLTPDAVKAYSGYVGNAIHTDPKAALASGFRAPVAQGMMTTTFMTGILCHRQPPQTATMRTRFLRPVFWDEAVDVFGRREGDGGLVALRCLNADGKLVTEGHVLDLKY